VRRAAALFSLACACAFGQHYEGWVDGANCSAIFGWAWNWDIPNTPIQVDVYSDGVPAATAQANIFRQDLVNAGKGDGRHGFSLPVPASLKDNNAHRISVYFGGTNTPLSGGNGGYVINCSPTGGYLYYYTDPMTSINASAWTQNGTLTAGAGGLTSADANGGSLISRVAVPDGTSDYEVAMTLNLASSGGSYIAYVKASPDARLGPVTTGTFYAMELANPTVTATACTSTLNIWKSINGSLTLLAQTTVRCHNGMVLRAIGRTGTTSILVDNVFYGWTPDTSLTSGQAGVGVRGAPAGNAVSLVRLGPIDRTPPSSVSAQTVKSSVFSNSVQLQWQTPPDDPNGTGVIRFDAVPSSGIPNGYSSPEIIDTAVSPSTTYNYPIYAIDAHFNYASPTSITVTTPPAGAVDPRRVGVRPTGSYWGGMGENIDLLSGNLNFTLPLLQAQGRGGWKLPINLTYNSQNWRQDPATWNLGADVGYGYGWKLLAGSLTPYWGGYFYARYYIFTDASGAEYRLDVYNNGVWTSKDSIYVSYDSNTNRLYFNDGSFWVMGCTSAGTEQDAGTMYPTLLQDSNGNQIFIRYQPGVGVTWPDSSARIREIEDVRAVGDGWGNYRSYTINL
jgi:hypothetical protein